MSTLKDPKNLMLQDMPMPADMNHHGTLFGGTMLSYLDKAGALLVLNSIDGRILLASMKEVNFKQPSTARDMISVYCRIQKVGRTSITVEAEAWKAPVNNWDDASLMCTAEIVYVSVDENLKPTPVKLKK